MQIEQEAALYQEASRGDQARELLEHPLLVEAFEKIDTEIKQKWQNSPVRDQQGREHLWMMAQLLQTVRANLESVATTGKLASMELERKRTMAQKVKQWASETF